MYLCRAVLPMRQVEVNMKKDRAHAKSRKAKTTENTSPFIRLILCGAKAAAVAFLAAFAVIFIGGFIGYSLKDPAESADAVGLTALFTSFFVCGFVSSRLERGNPIATGLFSAALYLIPILVISLILKASSGTSGSRAFLSLIALPISVVGAFFGNVRVTKRRTAAQMRRKR